MPSGQKGMAQYLRCFRLDAWTALYENFKKLDERCMSLAEAVDAEVCRHLLEANAQSLAKLMYTIDHS